MAKGESYYDKSYFEWQKTIGEFGGWANCTKFQPYIKPSDCVIDFGCGGGYLLSNLKCEKRIGIEVNEIARKHAESLGLTVYKRTQDIPNNCADVIISNHALEHTINPLQELQNLKPKLKKGGKIIFVVPCESVERKFDEKDINQHLFTWNPMCLGNLFKQAGYRVNKSEWYMGVWPKHIFFNKGILLPFLKRLGQRNFQLVTTIYGFFNRSISQTRVVAVRE